MCVETNNERWWTTLGRAISRPSAPRPEDAGANRMLDALPILVRRVDERGQCIHVNAAWSDFTGRDPAQDRGEGWRAAIHPDDLEQAQAVGERDFRLLRADGRYCWIHQLARPLVDPDGCGLGMVAAGIDITQSRQFQDRLVQSNAELEQFAYVASHDLREPLRMINGYLALIERRLGEEADADLREFLAFARDGAARMDRLILDLLHYSRIGRLSAPRTRVNLNDVVTEAMDLLGVALAEHQAMVCIGELPTVFASPDDMLRLFSNLLGNAIQYGRAGVPPRVVVAAQRQTGAWCVSVSDNGIGISRDFFERVFRMFQRLHGREERGEGSGIGLAICKKIVENHGGAIWVDSPGPDQGSVFSFTLPA